MIAPPALAVSLVVLLLAALPAQDDDPLKDIRSKEAGTREAAARVLAEDASPKAEAALLKAARGDDDLLVVLAAIEALDGREPSSRIEKGMVEAALESPFTRVRRAAAETLGRVDAGSARAAFLKKSSGKTFVPAATALARSIEAAEAGPERPAKAVQKESKRLRKALESKEVAERPVAARALVALARGSEEARVVALRDVIVDRALTSSDAEIVCAGLEAVAAAPDPVDLSILAALLEAGDLTSVVERRLEHAIASALAAQEEGTRSDFLSGKLLVLGEIANAGPRLARVAGSAQVDGTAARAALVGLLEKGDVPTRAAASKALGRLGADGAQIALAALREERDGRVQLQLVRTIGLHGDVMGETDEGEPVAAAAELVRVMESGGSDLVREAAAVALGRAEVAAGAVTALIGFAAPGGDPDVTTTAAVALGRTRSESALAPLTTLTGSEDWQARAAAAEGLRQLSRPGCVEPLLALLDDEDATVRATAHRALLRFSGREGTEVDPAEWPEWWAANSKRARYRTTEEDREAAEKYGYGVDESVIYRGLDVVVVPGRGDHIEDVLDRLGIQYRTARAGKVGECGLHPGAILLVGCTGEVAPQDIEVVRWHVRAGGALFTSCWALSYTVEPSFPAVLSKFPSPGEVVDNVFAFPTASASASPYLRGVFEGGVQPYYSLLGAHLIHVLDPERAEVLLDSPSAAARHGTGDLAAWFRVGHGTVLDTANHFEEQGFSAAQGLKKPIDRQAFAVNHMGLTPLQLRTLGGEKWWKSTSAAAGEVADLSVFRILTNFVREKRING